MDYPRESELVDELQQSFIFRDTLEMRRENEHSRAERECHLAKAVSDLRFAWNVLQDDIDNCHFSYVSERLAVSSGTVAISKGLAISININDEDKLSSLRVGTRVPYGGAEERVIVKGPKKANMFIDYYEFDDHTGGLSETRQVSKIPLLPHFASEINFLGMRGRALVNYLGLPLSKRISLQRYHARHPFAR